MNRQALCPECHSPLPADAPGGLCPRCLLKIGMSAESTGGSSGSSLIGTGMGWDPSERALMKPAQEVELMEPRGIDEVPWRYSHIGEHSRGGMGRILLVHDETIGRDVALKELLPPSEGRPGGTPIQQSMAVVARFLREAQLTGQLEHPGIVPVYELGRRADGKLYYTMKLVRGKTLHDALAEKKTFAERLKLLPHVVDLCQAIAYAHSRGVIHRDIKPRNVMVGEFGETVVIDWGLAKARGESGPAALAGDVPGPVSGPAHAASPHVTMDGAVLGTAAYMAPEQAAGDLKRVDERSDVYALGAVLYEVLTGRPPFTGASSDEVLNKVLAERPTPVLRLERRVAPELAAICERAMAREPADRHASAKELADDVQAFITGRIFREREARVSFLAAVYGFGAALIAGGIITLVAYNWKRIPVDGQAALLMATMLALLGTGLHFWKISARRPQLGHVLVFLAVLMFGANLFALTHIYHLNLGGAKTPGEVLFPLWTLGAFAVACAVWTSPVTIVALIASSLWFVTYIGAFGKPEYYFNHPMPVLWYCYPPLIAAVFLPACYRWGTLRAFEVTTLVVAVSGFVVTGHHLYVPRLLFLSLAMAAATFGWGLLASPRPDREKAGRRALDIGLVFAIGPAFAMSWRHAYRLYASDVLSRSPQAVLQYVPLALACLVAAVLWVMAATRHFRSAELRNFAIGFLIATLLLAGAATLGCASAGLSGRTPSMTSGMWGVFAMANAAALILAGVIAWRGVMLLDRQTFLVGVVFAAFLAAARVLEFEVNYQVKALILVCAGIALIAVGVRFESYLKKRRLV